MCPPPRLISLLIKIRVQGSRGQKRRKSEKSNRYATPFYGKLEQAVRRRKKGGGERGRRRELGQVE